MTFVVVVFFFFAAEPIENGNLSMHISVRAEQGEGSSGVSPTQCWGSIPLAGIWATWRPTQAFIGGKNCMNTVALEKFSFFMKRSLFTAYFKVK